MPQPEESRSKTDKVDDVLARPDEQGEPDTGLTDAVDRQTTEREGEAASDRPGPTEMPD